MLPISTPMRPNRPHIPSLPSISKSKDTKQTAHPNFGRICRLISRISSQASQPASRFPTTASLRRVVFGEAASRQSTNHPQDQKRNNTSFNRHNQRLLTKSVSQDGASNPASRQNTLIRRRILARIGER